MYCRSLYYYASEELVWAWCYHSWALEGGDPPKRKDQADEYLLVRERTKLTTCQIVKTYQSHKSAIKTKKLFTQSHGPSFQSI